MTQYDPITGDLIPAGQDAELERWGREMAGQPTEIESDIAELVMEVAKEWLRYAQLGEREEQVRCTWHLDEEGETLHVESETGHGGRFKINVSAQQLPDLPPIGPENDLGVFGVDERGCLNCAPLRARASVDRVDGSDLTTPCEECGAVEEEPVWVPRFLYDARAGDTIRPAGKPVPISKVTARYAPPQRAVDPVDPDSLPADRGTWHVLPSFEQSKWAHKDDHVVQPGDVVLCLDSGEPRAMKATFPIEILMTPAEVAAIELLGGWDNRVEQLTSE